MPGSHAKLIVWQKSMDLVLDSYRLAKRLPLDERFELSSQIRRAAVSIPANIAEGYGRAHRREYVHHLAIARGSARELETLLVTALGLEYVTQQHLAVAVDLVDEVCRMLTAIIRKLQSKPPRKPLP